MINSSHFQLFSDANRKFGKAVLGSYWAFSGFREHFTV